MQPPLSPEELRALAERAPDDADLDRLFGELTEGRRALRVTRAETAGLLAEVLIGEANVAALCEALDQALGLHQFQPSSRDGMCSAQVSTPHTSGGCYKPADDDCHTFTADRLEELREMHLNRVTRRPTH